MGALLAAAACSDAVRPAAPSGPARGGAGAAVSEPALLRIRFIARDSETGEEIPAGAFSVQVLPAGGPPPTIDPWPMSLVAAPDGMQTVIEGLPAGAYRLRVAAPGRKGMERPMTFRPGDRLVEVALDPDPPEVSEQEQEKR